MRNRFSQAIRTQRDMTESHNPLITGVLGIRLSGVPLVEVPNRPSYVYVQVRSSQAEVIQAFNSQVSPVYGLPVIIQWEGNRYIVIGRDTLRYSNWIDSSAYLPRHASTHEFEGSAGDVVFVSQQQFLPLLPMPSGTTGNKQIVIGHYNLMTATGSFQYFPTQVTVNLTAWNPTSSTGAQMVLVSLDNTNGALRYDVGSGSVFGNWLTGSADVLPKVPNITDISRYIPLAAIRLITGTSVITWDNIYDVRPLFGATRTIGGGGGGGASSSSGLAVLNNGILENYANQLNLLGAGFLLSHSGTEAELTILGGGGGGGSGFLALDTSNGPLFGPLVVYQKNPNVFNQYFDYSTIVGYLSGTNGGNFGAAGEFVNFSTGSQNYDLYVDDEGSGLAAFIGANRAMDRGPMIEISHNIDSTRKRGRYLNDIIQSTRQGGGFPITKYVGGHLVLNEADPDNTYGPSIEVQASFSAVTDMIPTHTGSEWSNQYPFPYQAGPYGWDTYNDLYGIITGTVHSYWNNQTRAIAWLTPGGKLAINQLMIQEYNTNKFIPPLSGTFSQGILKLVNGTATAPTTAVTDSTRIYLTTQFGSGSHVGYNYVYSRLAGSGFTIRSSDLQDNSIVAWLLVEPV